mgnify:CR=1 FL=1
MRLGPGSGQQILPIPKVELALITGSANWGLRFPEDMALHGVRVVARDVVHGGVFAFVKGSCEMLSVRCRVLPPGVWVAGSHVPMW